MVPGIAERERLAVEMRRKSWLAGARRGSARMGEPLAVPSIFMPHRSRLPVRIWRRVLPLTRWLGQRIDLVLSAPGTGRVKRTAALTR